ncbi:MAG: hypothetical protein NC131_13510 [Roseburia sp.]|nr:hypothetical protein [Roseburia sp.]
MAKGMSMEEFRDGLASEATKENEKLKEEISSLKDSMKKKNKEISSLHKELKEVKHSCECLGNRCFVLTSGLMCTYCGCGELCPHGITAEEYRAITKFMKDNNLPRTDETREKVNEFIVERRRKAAEKKFNAAQKK